ncbi:hypothetical protein AXF42_Ash019882 [Apostasia shenzhenica]|uniref:Uncharacterized protein n=1 Tax=Apostasia shenzhenica TaxID=1088818 RepID=A0A2H9ZX37_9ASPA|nr:hypothetical protein AXF42_Ash019882 [Apostasia shenzhenica]
MHRTSLRAIEIVRSRRETAKLLARLHRGTVRLRTRLRRGTAMLLARLRGSTYKLERLRFRTARLRATVVLMELCGCDAKLGVCARNCHTSRETARLAQGCARNDEALRNCKAARNSEAWQNFEAVHGTARLHRITVRLRM